jgi:hypothetical protein
MTIALLVSLSVLTGPPSSSPPWGKASTAEEKAVLDKTVVCTDGKSHFLVVAPHERTITQLLYGDATRLWPVQPPPWVLAGSHFFEPRFFERGRNDNFRGVDMRVYSEASWNAEKKVCEVSCGGRSMPFTPVEQAKAREYLIAAKWVPNPQEHVPHALLRDDLGRYYFVDRGYAPEQEKSFRVFVGQKGSLQLQKMTNVVSDSEGEIFSTKSGELRMVVDKDQPPLWIENGKKTTLRSVPVEKNYPLIYNELGVYTGVRLGTPCDDL